MDQRKIVAITSINPPHERLRDFLECGYEVVVAGDKRTDDGAWRNVPAGVRYLPLAQQREFWPKLSDLIGENTYARKNFAYLWAVGKGADVIWETDDDTFPIAEVGDPLTYLDGAAMWECDQRDFWNPYSFFAAGKGLWPRGLPLRQVLNLRSDQPNLRRGRTNFELTGVLQLLVSGQPDVDAIYRLTVSNTPIEAEPSKDLVLLGESLAPANTQATLWFGAKTYPFLYVPRWVSFRFSDIFKMYVAQFSRPLVYGGFLMHQIRNEHDLMADFRSEVEMHLGVESLLAELRATLPSGLAGIYRHLAQRGICDTRESEAAFAYSEALDACTPR